jgi:predicted nucleic acid-binding protein
MNLLVDTNVLARLSDTGSHLHSICLQAIPRLLERGDGLFVCAQTIIEYWSVATRPAPVNGLGFDHGQAAQELRDFDKWFRCLSEPPDIAARWRALVNKHFIMGKQAHDTRLVALMEAHGLTNLLTLNPRDFARFPGVACIDPSEIK